MTITDLLRVAELLMWGQVLIQRLPVIWRLLTGRARYFDLLFSISFGTAAVFVSFAIRGLLGADSEALHEGLHVLVIGVAVAMLRIFPEYERSG